MKIAFLFRKQKSNLFHYSNLKKDLVNVLCLRFQKIEEVIFYTHVCCVEIMIYHQLIKLI